VLQRQRGAVAHALQHDLPTILHRQRAYGHQSLETKQRGGAGDTGTEASTHHPLQLRLRISQLPVAALYFTLNLAHNTTTAQQALGH
jgi:hypothetical protein